jgi:hypothetical protein
MLLCINYYNRWHGNAVKGFSFLWFNVYMNIYVLRLNDYNRSHGNAVKQRNST